MLQVGETVIVNGNVDTITKIGPGKIGPVISFRWINEVDQAQTWGCQIKQVTRFDGKKWVDYELPEPHTVV